MQFWDYHSKCCEPTVDTASTQTMAVNYGEKKKHFAIEMQTTAFLVPVSLAQK